MGGEIFTHLRRVGMFEESHTKFYAATVLCALEHMHVRCIAYRDLKPENLVLDDKVLSSIRTQCAIFCVAVVEMF